MEKSINEIKFYNKYFGKVICCETKEDWQEFLHLAINNRWRFYGGNLPEETDNCIFFHSDMDMVVGNVEYYNETDIEIIKYQKGDFKNG